MVRFQGLDSGHIGPYSIPVPMVTIAETAATVTLLDHMTAPATQAGAFQAQLDKLYRMILYNVTQDAVAIAASVILGGSAGGSIESQMARASDVTVKLRMRSRDSRHPLKEFGALGRAIKGEVSKDGISAIVGVPSMEFTKPRGSRPGQGQLPLAVLAYNLEFGYPTNVTERSLQYFKFMASRAEGAAVARRGAGQPSVAKDSEAAMWWGLYARGIGRFSVPARPFLRPSIELAAQRFMSGGAPQFAKDFVKLWTTGRAPGRGIYGGTVKSGL